VFLGVIYLLVWGLYREIQKNKLKVYDAGKPKKLISRTVALCLVSIVSIFFVIYDYRDKQATSNFKWLDTSKIHSETMHDYPKMDMFSAYEECLKKSVISGDNWQVTQKKCGEDLLTNLCLSMNLPAGKTYALTLLTTGESLDMRCFNFHSKMQELVTTALGNQQQKDELKIASSNSSVDKTAIKLSDDEINKAAFSPQKAQKNLWKYYHNCLLTEIGKGNLNQIIFNRCLDIGIAWCNASGMPTSQNPEFSDITKRPNIDNAQCAINLESQFQATNYVFQSEYENYSRFEAAGIPYKPIGIDIRKFIGQ